MTHQPHQSSLERTQGHLHIRSHTWRGMTQAWISFLCVGRREYTSMFGRALMDWWQWLTPGLMKVFNAMTQEDQESIQKGLLVSLLACRRSRTNSNSHRIREQFPIVKKSQYLKPLTSVPVSRATLRGELNHRYLVFRKILTSQLHLHCLDFQ